MKNTVPTQSRHNLKYRYNLLPKLYLQVIYFYKVNDSLLNALPVVHVLHPIVDAAQGVEDRKDSTVKVELTSNLIEALKTKLTMFIFLLKLLSILPLLYISHVATSCL